MTEQEKWWDHQCLQPQSHQITLWDVMKENDRSQLTHDELVDRILFLDEKDLSYFLEEFLLYKNLPLLNNPSRSKICRETARLLFQQFNEDDGDPLEQVLNICRDGVFLQAVNDLNGEKDIEIFLSKYYELLNFNENHGEYIRSDVYADLERAFDARYQDIHAFSLAKAINLMEQNVTTKYSLRTAMLDKNDAKVFAEHLSRNTVIKEINLSSNDFEPEGIYYIAQALRTNAYITDVDLHTTDMQSLGAIALAEVLNETSIRTLNLGGNRIGVQGAAAIAQALATNTVLEELSLYSNNIESRGAELIAEALAYNTTLTSISVALNQITSVGAAAFATTLHTNNTLVTLDLSHNSQIGDDGAVALANALLTNRSLKKLSLNQIRIRDRGAEALAQALVSNKSLIRLSLRYDHIGENGGAALSSAMEQNHTLLQFDLLGSRFDTKFIEKKVKENQKLAKIKTHFIRPLSALAEPYQEYQPHDDELAWEAGTEVMARTMQALFRTQDKPKMKKKKRKFE